MWLGHVDLRTDFKENLRYSEFVNHSRPICHQHDWEDLSDRFNKRISTLTMKKVFIRTLTEIKVDVPKLNTTILWMPLFGWYVGRCGSKN